MTAPATHPASLDAITPEWMTAALSSNYPGTVVQGLRSLKVINGTATKVRYQLDFAPGKNPHQLQSSLWVKGGFEVHSAATAAGNRNEACFYRDVAPLLDCNTPASLYQSICPKTGEGLVLLEDLLTRNATFCDLTQPLTVAQTAAVLGMQAKYHAALWDSPRLHALSWLSTGGFIVENGIVDYFFTLWETSAALPRFDYVPEQVRASRNKLKPAVLTMLETNRNDAICFVHGDTHMGNLFIDGAGKPGYIDWQAIMRGSWAFDVAPLIVSALPVALRRAHERELLQHYLDRLVAYGAKAPSFDEAWLGYRRFALWSFMFALCPPQFQLEQNCCAVAERASAAVLDLETLAALGQP